MVDVPPVQGAGLLPASVTCNTCGVSVQHRQAKYREKMRQRGMRPVQHWVPDVRSEEWTREAARQASVLAAADKANPEDMDFVEAVSAFWDLEDNE